MSNVVIFGVGRIAELAHMYLEHDSPHTVVGFTVDRSFLGDGQFHDLPVVAFEDVTSHHDPAEVRLFIPIGYRRMNHLRAERVEQARELGYTLVSYVSSRATTFPDFHCGENCFILEDNTIQPFVEIGDDVVLWSGNHIGHHSVIDDHVMITSHVVVSGGCRIGPYSFLGVNATVRDEVSIAHDTLVGAGTTIMSDTEPFSVYPPEGTEASRVRSDRLLR